MRLGMDCRGALSDELLRSGRQLGARPWPAPAKTPDRRTWNTANWRRPAPGSRRPG